MKHVVSISGGTASAICADLVMKKYGRDNTTLFFMDTNWEDEDLHRFLKDLESYWEKDIVRFKDGRTPLQVGEDVKFILNSRVRQCSFQLKIKPFRNMIEKHEKPVTVHLGLDWSEEHRMATPKKQYEEIEGVSVDFPLTWKPITTKKYSKIVESWGIEIPRMYKMGYPHNNCGGRCVAQGRATWKRTQQMFPERFQEVMEWEEKMQDELSTGKGKTVVQNISLRELAKKGQDQMSMFTAEDSYGCFCAY